METRMNYPYAQIIEDNTCIGVGLWWTEMNNPVLIPISIETYRSGDCVGKRWTGEYDENGYGIFEEVPEELTTEE